jgi:hypothetical protein
VIPFIPDLDPLPLPAPAWLLWALLLLTFFLHVVPMNIVLGGSLLSAVARVRARRGDRPHEAALARLIGAIMPLAISAAVTMGVAALLFLQVLYGRVFFPSAIVMGWWWLGVIGLLIPTYYAAYLLAYRDEALGQAGTVLAWLIAAIAGLIALIYGSNMTLMLKPAEMVARYLTDGRGVQLNLLDATLQPRHLHMVLGAIAVSALAVSIVGAVRMRTDAAFGAWAIRYGALVCGFATALNIFVGIWWLAALPKHVLLQFMGRDPIAIWSLLVGILFTLAAAGMLAHAASGRRQAMVVSASAVAMAVGLMGMLVTRDAIRRISLASEGFQPATWVQPQWGLIAIFVVLLVGAIATVAWMVRVLVQHAPPAHFTE